jgi:valyl-tRNA synthetase
MSTLRPPSAPRQPNATAELAKSYTPAAAEPIVRAKWDAAKAFHVDPNAPGEPYCILIPPPNVTAALHLGHAFNNSLQDVLIRYHRMRGFKTLWMPGTDHAGIATQAVVEKRLLLQGKRRTDFTREQFVQKVQEWKDEYEATILEQLKAMGCSCDYDRTRFTMDEVCAKAVREAFFRLFKDGLIYRGKRLVNWDPVSQTALADDEVEMEEVQGHMWYLRYPLVEPSPSGKGQRAGASGSVERLNAPSPPTPFSMGEGSYVTVATTRPETMLGDTAVAINPKDPRAAHFVGKKVRLPIVGRVIPIIADDYVVRPVQFGGDENDPKAKIATGFLKVTPAHDPNDYEIGQRHSLPIINVMAPDATISDKHGWTDVSNEARPLVGLSREEARKKVVEWFKAHNLLEDVKPYTHSVGHSYRSHVPIEPYLSDQWYVKVTDDRMRGQALRAMAAEQYEGASNSGAGSGMGSGMGSGAGSGAGSGTGVSPVPGAIVKDELVRHRRNLPHWQIGGSTYFVTFRLQKGELSHNERRIVADAALHWHGKRIRLHLATVMPDHVHLILQPLQKEDSTWYSLQELMHGIKGYAAHEIQKHRKSSGVLWQDEYFDRIIRDDSEYNEKWNYVWTNSVKAGLVNSAEEYPFTVRPDQDGDSHGRDARATEPRDARATEPRDARATEPRDARATEPGDGELRFFPARYAKTFQHWHENLRDWCISRQLWWGHRIPVWVEEKGRAAASAQAVDEFWNKLHQWEDEGRIAIGSRGAKGIPHDGRLEDSEGLQFICIRNQHDTEVVNVIENWGFTQDPDVLDTWFSSALWPISTMGWPEPEAFPNEIPEGSALLNTFNPSSTLCTAREIITLWVSRMVMFNRYFRDGKVPFRHVYVHAMIQDGYGQKMSKSLGNGVDPRDIIHTHGADAMRFTLVQLATGTQDVRLPVDMICPHPACGHTFHPKEISTSAGYRVADAIQTCPACKKKMISGYGAASGTAKPTSDVPLARNSSTKFDEGRNFANKLWNAARFALSNLNENLRVPAAGASGAHNVSSSDAFRNQNAPASMTTRLADLSLVDRWIISRLHRTLHTIEDALADYQFKSYADAMYDFVWRDFCDWYLEAIKPTMKSNPAQQQVLRTVLNATMRMLHPIMPFVTETLWQHVAACGRGDRWDGRGVGLPGIELPPSDLCATAAWPDISCEVEDKSSLATFERIQALTNAIRTIRSERQVPPKKKIRLAASRETLDLIKSAGGVVETLAGVESIGPITSRPADAIPLAFEGSEILLTGLIEAIDTSAERTRLTKLMSEKERAIGGFRAKLSNEGYLAKAPADKVEETRRLLAQAEADFAAAKKALELLR